MLNSHKAPGSLVMRSLGADYPSSFVDSDHSQHSRSLEITDSDIILVCRTSSFDGSERLEEHCDVVIGSFCGYVSESWLNFYTVLIQEAQ